MMRRMFKAYTMIIINIIRYRGLIEGIRYSLLLIYEIIVSIIT